MTPHPVWDRAALALTLLAIDPGGLGGIWLRARAGPVRDRFITGFTSLPLPVRRVQPSISDDQLFGAVDIASSLSAGYVIRNNGLLATPAALALTMAERCRPELAGRLASALDKREGHILIALDEGADPAEALPDSLADRVAFQADLGGLSWKETAPFAAETESLSGI
ncbi:MAG: magnesium chelatase ATPase subunit D, partial [Pseudomonadota bacterium]